MENVVAPHLSHLRVWFVFFEADHTVCLVTLAESVNEINSGVFLLEFLQQSVLFELTSLLSLNVYRLLLSEVATATNVALDAEDDQAYTNEQGYQHSTKHREH